jgi:recombinational DNA repair protein (RecF pathway)
MTSCATCFASSGYIAFSRKKGRFGCYAEQSPAIHHRLSRNADVHKSHVLHRQGGRPLSIAPQTLPRESDRRTRPLTTKHTT